MKPTAQTGESSGGATATEQQSGGGLSPARSYGTGRSGLTAGRLDMADNKMSPELQIAIRRSPDYTAPSAELVALRPKSPLGVGLLGGMRQA